MTQLFAKHPQPYPLTTILERIDTDIRICRAFKADHPWWYRWFATKAWLKTLPRRAVTAFKLKLFTLTGGRYYKIL